MRFLLIVLLALVAFASARVIAPLAEAQYQGLFTSFVAEHNKQYDVEEFFHRYNIFKENLDFIRQHNAGNHSYTLGVNRFADLTFEEFRATHLGLRPTNDVLERAAHTYAATAKEIVGAPDSIDWRVEENDKGKKHPIAVNPIKDQASCGSCWAFSAVAAIEGALAIKNDKLLDLSEQQLVDCSNILYGNHGCNGGLMTNAFKYVINNGLTTQSQYPYTAKDGTCKYTKKMQAATIASFKNVPKGDENTLKAFVAQGPVSVAVQASGVFQLYAGGVLTDAKCGTALDHGVVAVGYGRDESVGKDYWIVRNSWGPNWGESGYIRIERGVNRCGIASMATQPIAGTKTS